MSLPEVLLWTQLKELPGEYKFRKQHPFGRYVADFYCDAAKLIIEVDGESHNRGDQPAFEVSRDKWFADQGVQNLRIAAGDVLSNMDGVIRHVISAADAAGPPPPLTRSPTAGGGGFTLEH